MSPMRVDGVCKSFDGVAAVQEVSLETRPGEVLALLGPNGAGKTSLIRMLLDIVPPDRGSISIDGHPLSRADRDRMGYLPEERGLYQKARVLEVLEYLGCLKGLSRGEARRRAEDGLERFGLAEAARRKVQALSKGMQQKVQLLGAVLHEPDLVVLDEPFSGLDPLNARVVNEVVRERAAAGGTVLLSTHQMEKVEALSDRVLMLHRGRTVLEGTLAEVRARHSDNAVWVAGAEGRLEGRPEVLRLEAGPEGRRKVTLAAGVDPADFLGRLVQDGARVRAFEPALTPLEEIFVRLVEGLPGAATPAGGPRAAPQVGVGRAQEAPRA